MSSSLASTIFCTKLPPFQHAFSEFVFAGFLVDNSSSSRTFSSVSSRFRKGVADASLNHRSARSDSALPLALAHRPLCPSLQYPGTTCRRREQWSRPEYSGSRVWVATFASHSRSFRRMRRYPEHPVQTRTEQHTTIATASTAFRY